MADAESIRRGVGALAQVVRERLRVQRHSLRADGVHV
jgi:hypothetical protein